MEDDFRTVGTAVSVANSCIGDERSGQILFDGTFRLKRTRLELRSTRIWTRDPP